jgi:type IV pilus modification protein PilV
MSKLSIQRTRATAGFSLLEVMIAVVILSVGLLALASLQVHLIRASADSKAQSIALSLAKDKLEQLRNFQTMAAYRALTDRALPTCPSSDTECITVGAVTFARGWTVDRYAFNTTTGFQSLADTVAVPAGYGTNNEFKRIIVQVSWQEASGATQQIQVEDALGALDPADSAKIAKSSRTVAARKPKVIIRNPAGTEGVIPIAIGNGSDTAATNPTPEVTGRGTNTERVVETRYDVLTYAALSGDNTKATAQNRVETSVVGCTCNVNNGGGVTGMRPTYWDGDRYTVPSPANFTAPAGVATNLAVPESRLCTACCRDHHDNSTAASSRILSGQAKFDPRRTTHDHYAIDSITDAATGTVATGDYREACRLIRVDGIFRVASDAFNDHMDLLETKTGSDGIVEHLPVPSDAATLNYAGTTSSPGFVLNYMNSRFVTGTAYNTRMAMTPSPALHPASVTITKSIYDFRWQHARGLYIDYLEPAAIAAITKAKADCAARTPSPCTTAETKTAVLKVLPFTSINLSEVANWRSFGLRNETTPTTESTDLITVTNDDFLESIVDVQPARGNALPGFRIPTSPPSGTYNAKASAEIFESNSGLALLLDPVDPPEFNPVTDGQILLLSGSAPSATSGIYSLTITKQTNANPNGYVFSASSASYPRIASSPNVSRCNYATRGGSKPNPYSCGNYNLGTSSGAVPIIITLSKFNYTDASRTSTAALSCTGADGPRTYTGARQVNYCRNYGISSSNPVTVSPARTIDTTYGTSGYLTSGDGTINETASFKLTDLREGDSITVPLVYQNESMTAVTCTYQGVTDNQGNVSYVYYTTPAACP